MIFNVTFLDHSGHVTINLPYNADFADSQQFYDYVRSQPILFPLTGTQAVTLKEIAIKRDGPITAYNIGQTVHLNLRVYDGNKNNWFAKLDLPDKAKAWVTPIQLQRWQSPTHKKIVCNVPAFQSTIELNNYDFYAYTTAVASFSADAMVLVTTETAQNYPAIFIA